MSLYRVNEECTLAKVGEFESSLGIASTAIADDGSVVALFALDRGNQGMMHRVLLLDGQMNLRATVNVKARGDRGMEVHDNFLLIGATTVTESIGAPISSRAVEIIRIDTTN